MESTLRVQNPRESNRRFFWPLRYATVRGYDSACKCKSKQSLFYGVFWPLLLHPSIDRNETWNLSSLSP